MARRPNSIRPPVLFFEETPERAEIASRLERTIVVHAPPSMSRGKLERLLRTTGNRPGFAWTASTFKSGMYLVESPERDWYDRVVADRRIRLGKRSLAVEPWRDELCGGIPIVPGWIRVTGLPIGLWTGSVFDRLVSDFTRIEEIDPKTLDREEKRWARLKVGLGCPDILPDKVTVEINSQFYEVFFQAE